MPIAVHGEPCGSLHGFFCLNGGVCYTLPEVTGPFCRCTNHYTGARCEELLLPANKTESANRQLAAFLTIALLIGIIIGAAVYYFCRVWKKKKGNQHNTHQQYSQVQQTHHKPV
ncbi:pro-neuregulin-4, membrane-bound isoform [Latimeria chalumnae]|uniref:pro-neuregulin-4, membrane-bound isoform n=1 Tax=Latimeria chalumnae TaxID=7897 RepID=UPI0003C17E7A|nr:PREDICTED: pro-neuregulin-4, membrane-bound isoform [Latimeria chalumnae]|eukprot:XP_005995692.1 PREDICTED: pro-neuregulin-4, membrane-bound isoform [Latimeria chalumnae]